MTKTTTKTQPKSPAAAAGELASGIASPTPTTPQGKIGIVVDLLKRPAGASIDELMTATGWQAHSVRGAMSGAVKKKLGLTVTSDKAGDVRVYRIPAETEA